MWNLGDDQVQQICGSDYALYLVFLRMTSYLLLAICIFNACIMVPLFMTGDPMPSDDVDLNPLMSNMNRATVLNISASPNKMVFAYIVAIVIIPGFAFFMVHKFRQQYYEWKQNVNPMKEFRDIDIARYCVEVRNLPTDEGVESL